MKQFKSLERIYSKVFHKQSTIIFFLIFIFECQANHEKVEQYLVSSCKYFFVTWCQLWKICITKRWPVTLEFIILHWFKVPFFEKEIENVTDELKKSFNAYYIGNQRFNINRSKYSMEYSTGKVSFLNLRLPFLFSSTSDVKSNETKKLWVR